MRYRIPQINEQDRGGGRILYLASVYLQVRGASRVRLVRRSRIPGAAAGLEQDARLGRIDVLRLINAAKIDLPVA